MRLLDKCGRDIHSMKYIAPKDLKAEHDLWLAKVRQAERMARALKDEKEFYETKSCYFGIVITDDILEIKVLDSIKAYFEEGEAMSHCVAKCEYYSKPQSIVLSAHDKDGHRIETVEYSLVENRVVQSRGVCNTNTEYHQRIIDLVNANADKFI